MIKILIPKTKGKNKTAIRGLWRNDKGKIFYDYLKIREFYRLNSKKNLIMQLECFKKRYNQEAIFYIKNNIGYCYYNKNKIIVLKYRLEFIRGKAELKTSIREALRLYNGVTIYNKGNGVYLLEVFYN